MTVTATELPEVERRGGAHPDLPATRPGQEMPEQDEPEYWDPPGIPPAESPPGDHWEPEDDCERAIGGISSRRLRGYASCSVPGCGGDF